jgi:DNA-directed RNA polymerase subunit K/omega
MVFLPADGIASQTRNGYEAVIVTSRRAREINTHRLKLLEMMMEDSDVEIDGTKITTLALRDVLDGKVKYHYAGEEGHAGENDDIGAGV